MSVTQELAAAVHRELPQAKGRFVRVERPVDGLSPLPWLAAQKHPVRGYWSARDGSLEVAAIGEADEIKAASGTGVPTIGNLFRDVFQRLEFCSPELRYFGGFRFGPPHPTDHAWRPFGAYRFLLPQVELIRRGDMTSLACNVPVHAADAALATLASVNLESHVSRGPLPAPVARKDVPDRAAWDREVTTVLDRIQDGRLRKLVLARRACFDFGQPLDAFELLMRLRESTDDCYRFAALHFGGQVAFMGAPPERLFLRMGHQVLTEAVAGTRPRGACPEEDRGLADELLHSPKERQEHDIVVRGILEALTPLCLGLKHEPVPHVVKLPGVQHLVTHFVGTLAPGVSDEHLFAHLHPTPAVGGYPREPAAAALHEIEPFDRGWYSAPVGWVGRDASEFAVAIRSGAVFGSRLCLFSGAGIVAGSEAAAEWNEVESKIGHFIAALTQH